MQWCHAPHFFETPIVEMHIKSTEVLNTVLKMILTHKNDFFYVKKNTLREDSFTFWKASTSSTSICKTWEYKKEHFSLDSFITLLDNLGEQNLIIQANNETISTYCNGNQNEWVCLFDWQKEQVQVEVIQILAV